MPDTWTCHLCGETGPNGVAGWRTHYRNYHQEHR
jgi:hypothetical protein